MLIVEPDVVEDQRGFFMETWHTGKFRQAGLDLVFVQDNHSRSARAVLRGLHYQIRQPQGKLVRVVAGEIFDVGGGSAALLSELRALGRASPFPQPTGSSSGFRPASPTGST